jgi:hypothetical protein
MRCLPLLLLAACATAHTPPPPVVPTAPEVGALAPDFELAGSDGKMHRLSEHRGKQAVVLAWFPKAFTGG